MVTRTKEEGNESLSNDENDQDIKITNQWNSLETEEKLKFGTKAAFKVCCKYGLSSAFEVSEAKSEETESEGGMHAHKRSLRPQVRQSYRILNGIRSLLVIGAIVLSVTLIPNYGCQLKVHPEGVQYEVRTKLKSQFAVSSKASTSYKSMFSEAHHSKATGKSDEFKCHFSENAWSPSSKTARLEWIEVGFRDAAPVQGFLTIHETFNAPFVIKVSSRNISNDKWVDIWSGVDRTDCPGFLKIPLDEDFSSRYFKIYTRKEGYEQIDSVKFESISKYRVPRNQSNSKQHATSTTSNGEYRKLIKSIYNEFCILQKSWAITILSKYREIQLHKINEGKFLSWLLSAVVAFLTTGEVSITTTCTTFGILHLTLFGASLFLNSRPSSIYEFSDGIVTALNKIPDNISELSNLCHYSYDTFVNLALQLPDFISRTIPIVSDHIFTSIESFNSEITRLYFDTRKFILWLFPLVVEHTVDMFESLKNEVVQLNFSMLSTLWIIHTWMTYRAYFAITIILGNLLALRFYYLMLREREKMAQKKATEEAARKKAEEDMAKKKAAEEAARKRAEEDMKEIRNEYHKGEISSDATLEALEMINLEKWMGHIPSKETDWIRELLSEKSELESEENIEVEVKDESTTFPPIPGSQVVSVINVEVPKRLEDLRRVPREKDTVKRQFLIDEKNILGTGNVRMAIAGRDVSSYVEGGGVAIKLALNSNKEEREHSIFDCQAQAVAEGLARMFSETKEIKKRGQLIKYIHASRIEFTDKEGRRRFGVYEDVLKGKFEKWTNNVSGISGQCDVLQAFSHWTYQASKGYLMVVDIQGIKNNSVSEYAYTLTDPAIHCIEAGRFGNTNLDVSGIKEFFRNHQCNEVCKDLGLTTPEIESD